MEGVGYKGLLDDVFTPWIYFGKPQDVLGYSTVYVKNKNGIHKVMREHRVIMENYLGRYLRSDEIIHHINGDKKDNNLLNLLIVNNKTHGVLHTTKLITRFCKQCGSAFVKHLSEVVRGEGVFCSKGCYLDYVNTDMGLLCPICKNIFVLRKCEYDNKLRRNQENFYCSRGCYDRRNQCK